MEVTSEKLYSELALILKKLLITIYELESGDLSNNVVMCDGFQIQKLNPRPDYYLPNEENLYPMFYYRDKEGNEIIITNQNIINVKLKDKPTIHGNDFQNFLEESDYLSRVANDLNNKSSKILIRN